MIYCCYFAQLKSKEIFGEKLFFIIFIIVFVYIFLLIFPLVLCALVSFISRLCTSKPLQLFQKVQLFQKKNRM